MEGWDMSQTWGLTSCKRWGEVLGYGRSWIGRINCMCWNNQEEVCKGLRSKSPVERAVMLGVCGVPSIPTIGKEASLRDPHIRLKLIWMTQYQGRKKYVFPIPSQLPMDQ
jgi:hypothetical protein